VLAFTLKDAWLLMLWPDLISQSLPDTGSRASISTRRTQMKLQIWRRMLCLPAAGQWVWFSTPAWWQGADSPARLSFIPSSLWDGKDQPERLRHQIQ
jgi:hypothetical protein